MVRTILTSGSNLLMILPSVWRSSRRACKNCNGHSSQATQYKFRLEALSSFHTTLIIGAPENWTVSTTLML